MQDRQTKTIVQGKAPGPSIKVILLGGEGLPAWAKEKKRNIMS